MRQPVRFSATGLEIQPEVMEFDDDARPQQVHQNVSSGHLSHAEGWGRNDATI
jgi:hypothetical protein